MKGPPVAQATVSSAKTTLLAERLSKKYRDVFFENHDTQPPGLDHRPEGDSLRLI